MCINAITKFAGIKRGSHNVPRFIYHLTTKTNYQKMLQSGSIIPTQDALLAKNGIFAFDLNNAFKCWGKKQAGEKKSLLAQLILFIKNNSSDIVLLKIPTSKLSIQDLKIRSQNRYLGWRNKHLNTENPIGRKILEILNPRDAKNAKQALCKKTNQTNAAHIIDGSPATLSKLFKQRKESIEYIYQGGEIPMKDVEKIGEANFSELLKTPNNAMSFIKKVFIALTKGTPENQAAIHLLK